MSDNNYHYLCANLKAAIDDAPGGEKAWVPLRRSLALACLEQLQADAATRDLLSELRHAVNSILPVQNENEHSNGVNHAEVRP